MDKKDKKAKLILTSERTISYVVLLLLTFLCLLPFYILLINATRSHPDIQKGFSFLPGKSFFTNLKNVLSNENLPVIHGIANSLLISGCNAILTTYFSSLTAYAIHAYEFKFKRALFLFILMIMMVPVQVSTLGFIDLMQKLKLMDSFIPLIAPSIAAPVVFFFMKQYMESNLAIEIIEAARIDGSGEFRTFNNIVLPIIKPAIAVQAIFAFVNTWNNYFVPSLIIKTNTKKTLPILIAQLRSADFLKFDMGQLYMLIAIAIFPVIIVYICLSKFIVRGVAAGSIKG
ncbi:carbohydrate ABC transporter permease [Anaerocolumna aminovalerica]|jgi:multiple sugar transport system permease protein|uniref:Carbohydrate ABC transporter membrane protein 2, CUT1 family n=1 Tax=Anaerocolumna aminovalerica TaxID=1527 RepID=A0A1I5FKD9_9FIRM|nr:carbohydrate ABC transporter permease [Anaerocolumna aminovalerica]MBU5330971.1 carbohydrate ABC transporter permease [Anaerocolumna aminovalerica]MDU6264693.1 carbohydrate ABC transporter permease [Anaerocolumna aminovalerica]SFO23771.1 carbohydrate ABC transporter membrane protein 2, CUT1 family [Anaerocolumna aminovalerica]